MQIAKKRKKLLSLMLALMITMGMMIPLTATEVAAATLVFEGQIDTGGSSGVGKFMVDGQRAFCLQHAKLPPSTGTSLSQQMYTDANIQKVLYYGWTGPKQWSGFTGENNGIVVTSFALDHFYSGGSYSWYSGYDEFLSYIKNQPTPSNDVIVFSKTSTTAYWDNDNKEQRTEVISLKGDAANTVTLNLPTGVTLVNNDTKEEKTGTVTLSAGTSFYLKAKAGAVSGTYSTGEVGKNFKYQPLVFKASGGGVQDLAQGRLVTDPDGATSLNVRWLDTGDLQVSKTNDYGDLIDGMEFNLKALNNDNNAGTYDQNFKVTDGKLLVEDIPVGIYTLTETVSPDYHGAPKPVYQVEIKKDQVTERIIVNRLAPETEVSAKKVDKDTGAGVPDTEFTVYATEDIYSGVTLEKLYSKGDKIKTATTDADGNLKITGLPIGKMKVVESKAAPGYVPNEKEWPVETRQLDFTTTVYPVDLGQITNKQTDTQITKIDSVTSEELPGAKMELYDKDGNLIEEWTSTEEAHVIKGLLYGEEYTLHENAAPAGYDLAQDIKFVVGAENKIVMKDAPQIGIIEMNDKIGLGGFVKTGDNMRFILPIMLLVLAGLSAAAIFTVNRKKEKEDV